MDTEQISIPRPVPFSSLSACDDERFLRLWKQSFLAESYGVLRRAHEELSHATQEYAEARLNYDSVMCDMPRGIGIILHPVRAYDLRKKIPAVEERLQGRFRRLEALEEACRKAQREYALLQARCSSSPSRLSH